MIINKSTFNILVPRAWNIKIEKVDDQRYRLEYVEKLEVPESVDFDNFVNNTSIIVNLMPFNEKKIIVDKYDRIIKIIIKHEDSIETIASMMVGEFIIPSSIGKISLSDIILYHAYEYLMNAIPIVKFTNKDRMIKNT